MGYQTTFDGEFACTPALKPEHQAYLEAFAETRRVKRDPVKAELLPDPVRIAAGLPIGFEGAYFVGGTGYHGQGEDPSVIDGNTPPGAPKVPYNINDKGWYTTQKQLEEVAFDLGLAQPGLWCQWTPSRDGKYIRWDEGEKFYDYIEWIQYLIAHFIKPWGYTLNGVMEWQGEDQSDIGQIHIKDNELTLKYATITWS